MKKLFAAIISIAISYSAFAQAQVTFIDFQKATRQAIKADMPYNAGTAEDAINDKMGKLGYKGKSKDGFTVFKGVKLAELGDGTYDLYFMVDKKAKKDKDNSVITLLIAKGNEQFVTDADNPTVISGGKTFLENFSNAIGAFDLEKQITEQTDAVKAAQKKAAKLEDDAGDLQKKKKKIEQQIEDNIKDQEKQRAELEKQNTILETLRSKRKS